jgi:hypothetical protein
MARTGATHRTSIRKTKEYTRTNKSPILRSLDLLRNRLHDFSSWPRRLFACFRCACCFVSRPEHPFSSRRPSNSLPRPVNSIKLTTFQVL